MVSLDRAVIARYKHSKKIFEILVDPDGAERMRGGGQVDLEDLLAADEVFTDAAKGEKATEKDLMDAFSTTEPSEIVKKIIKEGELHLTTEAAEDRGEAEKGRRADRAYRHQSADQHTASRHENRDCHERGPSAHRSV
jgi:ribosome maturation protein SDO1